SYKEFLNCKPRNFDGTEGGVGLTRWFDKLESVFRICNCAKNYQLGRTEEDDDIRVLSEKRTTKMETELWNFIVTSKYKKVERYISGLTCDIEGKITSSKPTKIQEAIRMAHDLMDQVIRSKVGKDVENKRKWEDDQGGYSCHQQNKRREVVRVYAGGSSDKKGYAGTLPLCDQCEFHHRHGPCPTPCENYTKVGHQTRDCWTFTSVTCYKCGERGHIREYCPDLENQKWSLRTLSVPKHRYGYVPP
nr:hypothetical protein [Tanacetum cinerariifolium]